MIDAPPNCVLVAAGDMKIMHGRKIGFVERMMASIRCGRGQHDRSQSQAITEDDGHRSSVCRFCGVPMKQVNYSEWVVVEDRETASGT